MSDRRYGDELRNDILLTKTQFFTHNQNRK